MSTTFVLFERWMKHKGFASERAAMLALGLSHATAQHWKAGRNGSLAVIERMAQDLGEDYVPHVMAAFQETAPNEAERKAWRRLAKRLGAAAIVLAVGIAAPPPGYANSGPAAHDDAASIGYIMRSVARRRKTRKPRRIAPGTFPDSVPAAGPAPCGPTFRRIRAHGCSALPSPWRTDELMRPQRLRLGGHRDRGIAGPMGRLAACRQRTGVA